MPAMTVAVTDNHVGPPATAQQQSARVFDNLYSCAHDLGLSCVLSSSCFNGTVTVTVSPVFPSRAIVMSPPCSRTKWRDENKLQFPLEIRFSDTPKFRWKIAASSLEDIPPPSSCKQISIHPSRCRVVNRMVPSSRQEDSRWDFRNACGPHVPTSSRAALPQSRTGRGSSLQIRNGPSILAATDPELHMMSDTELSRRVFLSALAGAPLALGWAPLADKSNLPTVPKRVVKAYLAPGK